MWLDWFRYPTSFILLLFGLSGLATQAYAWREAPMCALRVPHKRSSAQNMCLIHPSDGPELSPEAGERPQLGSSEVPWTEPITAAEARVAMERARSLLEQGRPGNALLQLRIVAHAAPAVRDRIALLQGRALLASERPRQAFDAFEVALDSPNRDIAARARIGRVRSLVRSGNRFAAQALAKLRRRYPQLPQATELRFELARAKEERARWSAISIYRSIDVEEPGSAVAARARTRLAELAQDGPVGSYTREQRVSRAERLVRSGPWDMARNEIAALRETPGLTAQQRTRVHLMAAQMARIEGRFETAKRELAKARSGGAPPTDARSLYLPAKAGEVDADERRRIEARMRAIQRRRPVRRLSNMQLRALLGLSLQIGDTERVDRILDVMRVRKSLRPAARFEAATQAAGVGSDERVAELLLSIADVRRFRVAASYHAARALERLGRTGEAEAYYMSVLEWDKSRTRYYAMWAEQRLWNIQSEREQLCSSSADDEQPAVAAVLGCYGPPPTGNVRVLEPAGAEATGEPEPIDEKRVAAQLERVIAEHGDAYPWFERALSLVRLGLEREATDELNEAYLAWRDARGSPRLRSGLEALYTGSAPPRRPVNYKLRRARLGLDREARQQLASVSRALGEPHLALRFGGWRADYRPRAYTEQVHGAARKYSIDPNLLFAVMRVESIYNRRIVSYAGAVGLMQIMPRTGRLIAHQLGVRPFEVTDLLDPRLNVEFSAWYLSSLIERFDGRLPLAIAAYNGGPHNVRLWLQSHHPDMPLDTFLEHIPFSQTHRYVRRVLTHYAAYRAQQDLPMTRLETRLPPVTPDPLAF